MAQRPYWSGQIRIALVFLPVHVFSATVRQSQIHLHELSRKTGERIHHQNVTEAGTPVNDNDIIKAYEYEKGEYVMLEDEELQQVKLPSSDTLELVQFADRDAIPLSYFERPFYVLPNGKNAQEIYGVVRDALEESGKAGLGQIALRGREELCALMPMGDGLLLETLRYPKELRDAGEFFSEIKRQKAASEYVGLARELIKRNSGKLDLSRFEDHYHDALLELIERKQQHRAPARAPKAAAPTKVIDLMDALRKSLNEGAKPPSKTKAKPKKPAAKSKRKSA